MPFRDPRSWGLAACGGVYFSRAAAYRPGGTAEKLPVGLAEIAHTFSVGVYGLLWAACGAWLLVAAYRKCPSRWWMTFLILPPTLWAAFYLIGGIVNHAALSLYAAMLFAFFAVIVGAFILEPPKPRRQKTEHLRAMG